MKDSNDKAAPTAADATVIRNDDGSWNVYVDNELLGVVRSASPAVPSTEAPASSGHTAHTPGPWLFIQIGPKTYQFRHGEKERLLMEVKLESGNIRDIDFIVMAPMLEKELQEANTKIDELEEKNDELTHHWFGASGAIERLIGIIRKATPAIGDGFPVVDEMRKELADWDSVEDFDYAGTHKTKLSKQLQETREALAEMLELVKDCETSMDSTDRYDGDYQPFETLFSLAFNIRRAALSAPTPAVPSTEAGQTAEESLSEKTRRILTTERDEEREKNRRLLQEIESLKRQVKNWKELEKDARTPGMWDMGLTPDE